MAKQKRRIDFFADPKSLPPELLKQQREMMARAQELRFDLEAADIIDKAMNANRKPIDPFSDPDAWLNRSMERLSKTRPGPSWH